MSKEEITENVKEYVNGVPAEIEYLNKKGEVIAFWAYGHFDPQYEPLPPHKEKEAEK